MVRAFNREEKEILRQQLIQKGKELFERFGLKKTSITELTKAVGIAQGTFYQFFASKELLFFEIIELEELKIKEKMFSFIESHPQMTKDLFKEFLLLALKEIDGNPIIRSLINENNYEQLMRKLPQERVIQHIKRDSDLLLPIIKLWQDQNIIIKERAEVISGVIRGFILMSLHRKELGTEIYDKTIELYAEFIADGLIRK